MSLKRQSNLLSFFSPVNKQSKIETENGENVEPAVCTTAARANLPPSIVKTPSSSNNSMLQTRLHVDTPLPNAGQPITPAFPLLKGLHPSWYKILEKEYKKPYFSKLDEFVMAQRRAGITVYPSEENVFTWSRLTLPQNVKVVILGQDPYHGVNQAHGLCFSVLRPTRPPPSLLNIFKELEDSIPDFKRPDHGDLTGWAEQGVLLLNACLTVKSGEPNSHKDRGWEHLTDAVVAYLNECRHHLVFMLWGADAQRKGAKVDSKRHLVLTTTHPSPLSAHRGFLGCGHFKKANEYLKNHGLEPIDWSRFH